MEEGDGEKQGRMLGRKKKTKFLHRHLYLLNESYVPSVDDRVVFVVVVFIVVVDVDNDGHRRNKC